MDNALRSPSVAVSELLDLIDHIAPTEGNHHEPHQQIVVDQPLQPFAPRLFGTMPVEGPGRAPLHSAALRWCNAAVTVLDPARHVEPFVTAPLPEPAPLTHIPLADLAAALADPPEWFWRKALGLSRPGSNAEELDSEPILPEDDDTLDLSAARIKHARLEFPGVLAAIAEEIELPYGELAAPTAQRREADLAVAVRAARGATPRGPLAVQLAINGVVIEGQLQHVGAEGMLQISPHPLSGKTLLRAWVHHLALNAAVTDPGARTTTLVGVASTPDKSLATFAPVDDAPARLAELVDLYRTLQRQPVACFPRSAMAAAVAMCRDKDVLGAVRPIWHATRKESTGEADSAVVQRLYDGRDLDPQSDPELWNEFVDCVTRLVRPMVEHLTVGGAA
jgi:exodeoxyribonuclease V gamma subunit